MKKNIFKKLIQKFLDAKLKYKLLLIFIVLTVIPLMIFSFLTFGRSSDVIYSYISFSATQSFNQTHNFISYKIYRVIDTIDIISVDNIVNDILMKNNDFYRYVDQVEDMNHLKTYLSSFEDDKDVYKVRLYVPDGRLYSDENSNLFNLNTAKKAKWYEKLNERNKRIVSYPAYYFENEELEKEVLSFVTKIKNRTNYTEIAGLLRIDIEKSMIVDILSDANPTDTSITYLLNSENDIVATSGSNQKIVYDDITLQRETVSIDGIFQESIIDDEIYYFTQRSISNTDWTMVTVIPKSGYINEISKLRHFIILMIFIIGTIIFALAYGISGSITKRIKTLIYKMRDVQMGELNIEINNKDKDEIGILFNDFKYMLERINLLVEEKYKMGQELKSTELKALQSQINPHFLYNTLDMIKWMSHKNLIDEINTIISALANYYKMTLNKGKDLVTIEDELKHISYYVQIQNFRFSNRIKLNYEIDEDILNCKIPKITLQPLVENAIQHGILEKENKEGEITIKGKKNNNTILISVLDDGVGMSDEMLQEVKAFKEKENNEHYGIRNVNQRIKLIFGEEYGLMFESIKEEGTIVDVQIPLI